LLGATITLGLAALGSGFVAAVNTETALREGADVWSSFDHLEMLSKRARDNDGALDSLEAANIREQRQRVETEIEEANAADADRNAAWGAAVPAWIGVVVCLVRWLRARRVAAPPPPVPA
jgi:hypothetical protein